MAMTASVPGFDTRACARRRKEAGGDEAQAEAHAEAVRDAITEGVATKADLKAAVADLRADLKAAVADLKADMLKVAIGIVIANAGLTVALVKLLPQAAP